VAHVLSVLAQATPFTARIESGRVLRLPIAHGEGRYFAPPDLLAELESYLPPPPEEPSVLGFAVPLELASADGDLRLITTITSFATAADVTLAELQPEAFLPADERTAEVLGRRWG
jgi:hypothetical protein